ncbi:MAG TPA: hypothetical protein VEB69_07235 [Acidimicrobiia bacterium]|nr:hypothetical protein [Acidimicrobiia bacterium]
MGQNVEIKDSVTLGEVLVIDTDRSFTGQDGHAITTSGDGHGVPGRLAERLFGLNLGIDHVYVLQNTVTVRRSSPWDDQSAGAVADVTASFLRFYPDDGEDAGSEEE